MNKDELNMELVKLNRKLERAERAFLKDQFILYGISEVWDDGIGWKKFPEYTSHAHVDHIQSDANRRLRKSAIRLREIQDQIDAIQNHLHDIQGENESQDI